jgi:hypothetical protein
MPADLIFKTILRGDDDAASADDEPQHPVEKVFAAALGGFDAHALGRERVQSDFDFSKRFARFETKKTAAPPPGDPSPGRLEKRETRNVSRFSERPKPLRIETELQKNGHTKVTKHFGVNDEIVALYITEPGDWEYNEL